MLVRRVAIALLGTCALAQAAGAANFIIDPVTIVAAESDNLPLPQDLDGGSDAGLSAAAASLSETLANYTMSMAALSNADDIVRHLNIKSDFTHNQ